MIITKKHLPRRTFLRGMGVTAGSAFAGFDGPGADPAGSKTAANPQMRLGYCYIPHGGVMATGLPRRKAQASNFRAP